MSTFLELQNLVIAGRFKEGDRDQAKGWINARGQEMWNGTRWSFAQSGFLPVPTVATQNEILFPVTLRTVEHVYDELGDELEKIPYTDLKSNFRAGIIQGSQSKATHFAVRNRTIVLSHLADRVYAFTCDGQLVWGHDDGTGAFVAGDMTLDTDLPYWPANHHGVLVPAAKATGMKRRSDPTFPPLEDETKTLFAAMVTECAEDTGISSYGARDPL